MEWWVGILSLLTSDNSEMLVYSINGVMKFTPSLFHFRQFGLLKFKAKKVQYLVAAVLGKAWESC
jgi:hypothetical protein